MIRKGPFIDFSGIVWSIENKNILNYKVCSWCLEWMGSDAWTKKANMIYLNRIFFHFSLWLGKVETSFAQHFRHFPVPVWRYWLENHFSFYSLSNDVVLISFIIIDKINIKKVFWLCLVTWGRLHCCFKIRWKWAIFTYHLSVVFVELCWSECQFKLFKPSYCNRVCILHCCFTQTSNGKTAIHDYHSMLRVAFLISV